MQDGVAIDPSKIKVVVNCPYSINVIEVRSFLSMANYYQRIINDFSKISLPLYNLIRNNENFE